MIEALHAIKRRQSELVAFFLSLESTILSVMLDRTKITYSALWNFGFVLNIVFSINHSTYIIWFLFSECVSRKIFSCSLVIHLQISEDDAILFQYWFTFNHHKSISPWNIRFSRKAKYPVSVVKLYQGLFDLATIST